MLTWGCWRCWVQPGAYCSDPTLPPEDALKTFGAGFSQMECLKTALDDPQCGVFVVAGGPAGQCNCVKKGAQCNLNQYNTSAGSPGAQPHPFRVRATVGAG